MTTGADIDVPATVEGAADLARNAAAACTLWSEPFTIETPGEYAAVDSALTALVTLKDALVAQRKGATGPLYAGIRTVEGWFRPHVDALERTEKRLKVALGAYRLERRATETAARERAASAASTGDGTGLLEALEAATEAAEAPAGRATVAYEWRVASIDSGALPDEWWCPDTARIAAAVKAHRGESAPEIPGVTFERVARVGARR